MDIPGTETHSGHRKDVSRLALDAAGILGSGSLAGCPAPWLVHGQDEGHGQKYKLHNASARDGIQIVHIDTDYVGTRQACQGSKFRHHGGISVHARPHDEGSRGHQERVSSHLMVTQRNFTNPYPFSHMPI